MSLMVEEVYRALVSAGASDEEAASAARAIPNVENLATKQDLTEVRAELKQEIAELRAEIRSEFRIIKFVYGPAVLIMLAKLVFFPS